MAPHTPQGSERHGFPGALLDRAHRPPHVSTIWVWIVSDRSRPDSSVTRVCQTIVRRPRWSGVDSARTVPDRPAAKKLVLDSSVVVLAPAGGVRAGGDAAAGSATALR